VLLRGKEGSSQVHLLTQQLRERARLFFAALPYEGDGRHPFGNREEFLESSGDLYLAVTTSLKLLEAEFDRLSDTDEAPGLEARAAALRADLTYMLESKAANMVFWLERRGGGGSRGLQAPEFEAAGRGALAPEGSLSRDLARRPAARSGGARATFMQATPIDVSEILHNVVWDQLPTAVLTSATLTVQGGFEHLRKRLGLGDASHGARELVVPSHFRYEKQALLYLPPQMPDPRAAEFPEAAALTIERILRITRGRAFCLFTSYSQMRALYERLLPVLDYPILLHGTAPRKALLEEFRVTPNAVLFGTASFWQGVDVQGFGRLIRSLEDRGVLVLLDPRVRTQRYGQIFLQSLPPYRVTQNIVDVEAFFANAGNIKAGTRD
jgi:ATP-dependent DNA helicase DinG